MLILNDAMFLWYIHKLTLMDQKDSCDIIHRHMVKTSLVLLTTISRILWIW